MFHLIEHLTNPLNVLKSIYASLQSGDKLIIEAPNINSYSVKRMNYKNSIIYYEHFFYFNLQTLTDILKVVGFKVMASGKREFNQNNLSIRESLFRLGLVSPTKNSSYGQFINHSSTEQASNSSSLKMGWLRKMVRKFLNKLVIILRRQDFIWIIAEK